MTLILWILLMEQYHEISNLRSFSSFKPTILLDKLYLLWNNYPFCVTYFTFVCVKRTDAAEIISAISLTPLERISEMSLISQKFIVYRISRFTRSHIQKGFNRFIRGLGGFDWRKTKGKISWHCPFNIPYFLGD
jgi:hypothetical protein